MTPDTSAHWGFFTPNAVWRWGEPGSARGERETCECVKTGVEDNRFTLCNLANDEGVTTASFPAWLSESVDKRETFPPSILLKQQKPSAKQNIVFPRFLSELCRFLFFIAPDSAPIFDKGRKVQKLLMSVISVNSLPSTEALALKLTPLLFPERLITRWENLLCVRFITGPGSCLGFFYFTERALLEKRDCFSWFPTTYPIRGQSRQRS